ncbi:demethoxyubiquinone hydroxylase family protein [Alphaproteobacteria bacterium]|nr:demethoxyubiquinone hydroxylase family protein [Alphaproteobacteria bacterium]
MIEDNNFDKTKPETSNYSESNHDMIEKIIRVNQAGEYGAKRIYEGQMSILKNSSSYNHLNEIYEQEKKHLNSFNKIMVDRNIRPTILQPLWHLAGFALGAGSAILGERAAMACTLAVEEVIEDHYKKQSESLNENEKELRDLIDETRNDEINHMNIAIDYDAEKSPLFKPMTSFIKKGTKIAIWLSERV